MCLYKRAFERGPTSGAQCPISIHMGERLQTLRQHAYSVTVGFADGSEATGELLIGADGINSQVLEAGLAEHAAAPLNRGHGLSRAGAA